MTGRVLLFLSKKGDQVELAFTAGARSYTISLNKTGEVGGHIRIAEGGKTVADRPLTQEVSRRRIGVLQPAQSEYASLENASS